MFLPENIDLAYSEKYNLSIRLTPNGFSFCIVCPKDPSVFHFQETTVGSSLSYFESIKKLIFDLGFFSQPFNKTKVIVVNELFTLVPGLFFESSAAKKLFKFNFHNINGVVLNDSIADNKYYNLFNIDEEIHSILTRHLINPEFNHQMSILLKFFNKQPAEIGEKRCYLDFQETNISVICFSDQGLLSANSFEAINYYDTSYYITSIWDNLEFDQTSDLLYISGDTSKQKPVLDTLKKMIYNINEIEFNPRTVIPKDQIIKLPTDIIADLCV